MQYPHIITSQAIVAESVQDAEGNWITPEPSEAEPLQSICRARPNDKGKTLSGEDGTVLDFAWIVYMPLTAPDFNVGATVEVSGVMKGLVKRFFRGQINCTLWA